MNHFYVHLDYETSNRAGAGGMFQVASIEDANNQDVTERLVDVGVHYPDLEALQQDIAKRLGVPADQVELQEV